MVPAVVERLHFGKFGRAALPNVGRVGRVTELGLGCAGKAGKVLTLECRGADDVSWWRVAKNAK